MWSILPYFLVVFFLFPDILLFVIVSPITSDNCPHGSIQLMGGNNPYEGRVEVCINRKWGTVCNRGWRDVDARVACRKLGYNGGGIIVQLLKLKEFFFPFFTGARVSTTFAGGDGPIFMTNLGCYGHEQSLMDCYFSTLISRGCDHTRDAGVICEGCSHIYGINNRSNTIVNVKY